MEAIIPEIDWVVNFYSLEPIVNAEGVYPERVPELQKEYLPE